MLFARMETMKKSQNLPGDGAGRDTDVLIIGAGPAGLSLAVELGSLGQRPLVRGALRQLRRGFDQQRVEHVEGFDQRIEQPVVECDLPQPQPVEQILRLVCESGQRVLPEHSRQALERVRSAKDCVEELRVRLMAPALVEGQQVSAQRLEDLVGLGDELGQRAWAGQGQIFR